MTESSVLGCLNVVIESIWEHVQCLNLQKQPIKTIIHQLCADVKFKSYCYIQQQVQVGSQHTPLPCTFDIIDKILLCS